MAEAGAKKPVKGFDARKFGIDLATGGTAAAISKTAVAPIERVKLLLQVCRLPPSPSPSFIRVLFSNSIHVFKQFFENSRNFELLGHFGGVFFRSDESQGVWAMVFQAVFPFPNGGKSRRMRMLLVSGPFLRTPRLKKGGPTLLYNDMEN
jgi:hypothetical protein